MDLKELNSVAVAEFPDVKLALLRKCSYTDVSEDKVVIWKGKEILGLVNAKDATPYLILIAVKFYTDAYGLAERRTENRLRDAIGQFFKFGEE